MTLEVEPISGCRTIQVLGLPESPDLSEDLLKKYFENQDLSGGGKVTRVQLGDKGDYAVITFADDKGMFL